MLLGGVIVVNIFLVDGVSGLLDGGVIGLLV